MDDVKQKYLSIDQYIADAAPEVRHRLEQIRKTIQAAVPNAQEAISYNLPAFKLEKVLLSFGAYENHIGFYPTPSALEEFASQLKQYKPSKGAVKFPLGEPIPIVLIADIAKFRANEMPIGIESDKL